MYPPGIASIPLANAALANKTLPSISGPKTAIMSGLSSIINRYTVRHSISAFNSFILLSCLFLAMCEYILALSFLRSIFSSELKLVKASLLATFLAARALLLAAPPAPPPSSRESVKLSSSSSS